MKKQALVNLLKEKNYTISFAESCTGGMIASTLVDVAGASSVFGFGFVTYSAEAKMELLGVKKETIEAFGIVSLETAMEMAFGASTKSGSNIAVSVTGCAGPTEDEEGNPAGTICFGFFINGNLIAEKKSFNGKSRNENRALATDYAIERIYQLISQEEKL